MAVDILQEKIRKLKNPSVLELAADVSAVPQYILEEEGSEAAACGRYCRELLEGLRQLIPAVRFRFASFALLGPDGLRVLTELTRFAGERGYYVLMDAPELLSPAAAEQTARAVFGQGSIYSCDGLVISAYSGSDMIKPFLEYCTGGKKDIFAVVRTANKSAPELQDLLAGSRLVHVAAADHVNRYGSDSVGKFGYSRVGVMAAASSAESLRNLRGKYPKLFVLIDGYDYPNANAKNCSYAFDKFGHGAVACGGYAITAAWKSAESDGRDWLQHAVAAAERMKKNLTRYVTVL